MVTLLHFSPNQWIFGRLSSQPRSLTRQKSFADCFGHYIVSWSTANPAKFGVLKKQRTVGFRVPRFEPPIEFVQSAVIDLAWWSFFTKTEWFETYHELLSRISSLGVHFSAKCPRKGLLAPLHDVIKISLCFSNYVLQISDGVDDVGGFNNALVGYLFLAWVLCYLCVFKGVHSAGKVTALSFLVVNVCGVCHTNQPVNLSFGVIRIGDKQGCDGLYIRGLRAYCTRARPERAGLRMASD